MSENNNNDQNAAGLNPLLRFRKIALTSEELVKKPELARNPTNTNMSGVTSTRICPFFFSPTGCALGTYCQFLHHVPESHKLAAQVAASHTATSSQQQQKVVSFRRAMSGGISGSKGGGSSDAGGSGGGSGGKDSPARSGSGVTTPRMMSSRQASNMSGSALNNGRQASSEGSAASTSLLPPAVTSRRSSAPSLAAAAAAGSGVSSASFSTTAQREAAAATTAATLAFTSQKFSSFRWFWRELACDFGSSERGLGWRNFHAQLENDLEAAFVAWREDGDGPPRVTVCNNKSIVDFEKMQLCNAVDGGSRRAVQRVKVVSGFFWFACEMGGKASWKCPDEVAATLEREYIAGTSTTFGLCVGPRPMGLVNFDQMVLHVLPECAPLLSSVLEKETLNSFENDFLKKQQKAKRRKDKQRRRRRKAREEEKKKKQQQQQQQQNQQKLLLGVSDTDSPNVRRPGGSPFSAGTVSSSASSNASSGSDNDDDDDDMSDLSDSSSSGDNSSDAASEIEIIADMMMDEQQQQQQKQQAAEKAAKTEEEIDEAKQKRNEELAAKIRELTQSAETSSSRVLTMRLHRQPLQVTAACGASDFFGVPKIRERAAFVADNGSQLFCAPELGPEVFSSAELQQLVLPCIRPAVLGTTPQSSDNPLIAPKLRQQQQQNSNSNNNNAKSSLPDCVERCLQPDINQSATATLAAAQHMHAARHRCCVGRTPADCFLHEIVSQQPKNTALTATTTAAAKKSSTRTSSPPGKQQQNQHGSKFISVCSQLRARLHAEFFSHTHSTPTSGAGASTTASGAHSSAGLVGPSSNDHGATRWHQQQKLLREFRSFADSDNAQPAAPSVRIVDPKQTPQQQKREAESLLPIRLLNEGIPEWVRVVEWCASGVQTDPTAAAPARDDDAVFDATSPILKLLPRIRRIERPDLVQRYRRTRNDIFHAWLDVERAAALASGERLLFLPATADELASLTEPADAVSGMTAKKIVFTNWNAALLAAKSAATRHLHAAATSGGNNSSGTRHAQIHATVPMQQQVGIVVCCGYLGPQTRAKSVSDRSFNFPTFLANHPFSDAKCVVTTSAYVPGENSFAALFLSGLLAPMYFVSVTI